MTERAIIWCNFGWSDIDRNTIRYKIKQPNFSKCVGVPKSNRNGAAICCCENEFFLKYFKFNYFSNEMRTNRTIFNFFFQFSTNQPH